MFQDLELTIHKVDFQIWAKVLEEKVEIKRQRATLLVQDNTLLHNHLLKMQLLVMALEQEEETLRSKMEYLDLETTILKVIQLKLLRQEVYLYLDDQTQHLLKVETHLDQELTLPL